MASSSDINSELESFREQWRAEVKARKPTSGAPQASSSRAGATAAVPARPQANAATRSVAPSRKPALTELEDEYVHTPVFEQPTDEDGLGQHDAPVGKGKEKNLVSALDHYEAAVDKETQGSLGDSLRLYRKAFRMDHAVDKKYKNKHFPTLATTAKTAAVDKSSEPAPAATTSQAIDTQPQSLKELIRSFAGLAIEPAPPEIEGTPAPPCPIASLPEELLAHILRDVAVDDVGDFVRLTQVCKRIAYIVATEDQIWRRICLGREFGFSGMHYRFQQELNWKDLDQGYSLVDGAIQKPEDRRCQEQAEALAVTNTLLSDTYSSSWQRMFCLRPRIRFNGCYISTVNYIRSGQASVHQTTWNSPVHIVTYFRYLRFFRDGTVISLQTSVEPVNVVHHLAKELLLQHQGGAMPHLPSNVMQLAYRGRWRLSSADDTPLATLAESEGDLFVETEGVGRYSFRMDLSLGSVGKGSRNNKLVWRGHYSYDKLTDEYGEFTQKNNKAFVFSRVKSYSMAS